MKRQSTLLCVLLLASACSPRLQVAVERVPTEPAPTRTVVATTTALAPTGTPLPAGAVPITVLAAYYPWYVAGRWDDPTVFEPQLGKYGSLDPEVIDTHLKWAVSYGIDGWLIDWPGSQEASQDWEKVILAVADRRQARFGLMIDLPVAMGTVSSQLAKGVPYSQVDPTTDYDDPNVQSRLVDTLRYAAAKFLGHDSVLRMRGRPAIYLRRVGAAKGDLGGALLQARQRLLDETKIDLYLIADGPVWDTRPGTPRKMPLDALMVSMPFGQIAGAGGSGGLADRVDAIQIALQQAQNIARDGGVDFIPTLIPGYDDHLRSLYFQPNSQDTGHPVVERDPQSFAKLASAARTMLDPAVASVFVMSWNQWYESTAIEPSTSYGTAYLTTVQDELTFFIPEKAPPARSQLVMTYDQGRPPPGKENMQPAINVDEISFLDASGKPLLALDIGMPAAHAGLGLGWGPDQKDDKGRTYAPASSPFRQSMVDVALPAGVQSLRWTGSPIVPRTTVTLTLNGKQVGVFPLKTTWQTFTTTVPAATP